MRCISGIEQRFCNAQAYAHVLFVFLYQQWKLPACVCVWERGWWGRERVYDSCYFLYQYYDQWDELLQDEYSSHPPSLPQQQECCWSVCLLVSFLMCCCLFRKERKDDWWWFFPRERCVNFGERDFWKISSHIFTSIWVLVAIIVALLASIELVSSANIVLGFSVMGWRVETFVHMVRRVGMHICINIVNILVHFPL